MRDHIEHLILQAKASHPSSPSTLLVCEALESLFALGSGARREGPGTPTYTCIRHTREEQLQHAWCGREVRGFSFMNVDYVGANAASGSPLPICPECVSAVVTALHPNNPESPPPVTEAISEQISDAELGFRFVLGHAKTMFEAAKAEAEPGEWPIGQEWSGLGNTSKQTFIRRACEDVGVPHERYRRWLDTRSRVEDFDELYTSGV